MRDGRAGSRIPGLRWPGRGLLRGAGWRLPALALASAATGATEAALLGVIAQVALALSTGAGRVTVSLGPVSASGSVAAMIAAAAVLAGLRLLLNLITAWLPARIAADLQADLRRRIVDAYLAAGWPTQAGVREGHLQDLLTTHTWRVANAVMTVTGGLGAALTFAALLAGAFLASPLTALVLLAVGGVLFALLRPLALLQRRQGRRVADTGLDLAGTIHETTRLAEEHHVFGTTSAQGRRLAAAIDAHREPFFRTQLIGRLAPAAYQSVALLLLVAGLAMLAALPTADLAAVGTVVLILVRSLAYGQQLQGAYTTLNELLPFVEQVEAAIGELAAHPAPDGPVRIDRIDELRLEGVSFGYHPEQPVLRDVEATIRRGEVVGVVGPSGAGKSTLVQLLLRLRQPQQGRYLVNGEDAARIRRADWHRLVAAVPQDPKLLRGTIADNIRFLRDLDETAVRRAAELAHIDGEITTVLGGYDAVIDHRGDTVSGGQRQRIALARALAGRPELLVLDEPTSALDARSEALILDTLRSLKGEVTIVVVAHRPALLEICDQVWRVEDGRIAVSRPAPVVADPERPT